MEEIPRASREVRSISTVRIRASDQEVIGGYRGIVEVLPEDRRKVRASKVMLVRAGLLASQEDRLL